MVAAAVVAIAPVREAEEAAQTGQGQLAEGRARHVSVAPTFPVAPFPLPISAATMPTSIGPGLGPSFFVDCR